ncbi:hypothetical protein C8R48DRAFT_675504 [Suillus tomentosus]|nr:hypothetical protein C8R48DRAFT_675504 [Suillus tomentosus]
MYNTSNNFHLLPEYLSDDISLKQSIARSKPPNDFGAGLLRSSLSAYNGISGGNTSSAGATGSYRLHQLDGLPSQPYSNTNNIFRSHQSLNLQHQLSQQSQQSTFSNSGSQMLNGIHLQSQTPYSLHLQSNGGAAAVSASNARPMGIVGQMNFNVELQSVNSGRPEEISTIFVVGFPDDMQEREFQNMFTFSSGFEAVILKIPNKEYAAYGLFSGTTSTAPSGLSLDEPSHFKVGRGLDGQPPQKEEIIGFAKFRTRQEALEVRDLLQGRCIDIEKGAILKAKMAKKNLYIKYPRVLVPVLTHSLHFAFIAHFNYATTCFFNFGLPPQHFLDLHVFRMHVMGDYASVANGTATRGIYARLKKFDQTVPQLAVYAHA